MSRERVIVRQCVVPAVVGADGSGTFYSPQLSGQLESIQYIKTDYADTADFSITAETSTETIWTEANVTTATIKRPRAETHSTTGAAALYAEGGTAVQDKFALADDRLKIAISNAGVSKTGSFVITILGGRAFRPPGVPVVPPDEGGGATPEWVPDGATAFIDFTASHYFAGGAVVADPATLFATPDENYGDSFDASNISSEGLAADQPRLAGALLTDANVLVGATIVVELAGAGANSQIYIVDSSAFNFNVFSDVGSGTATLTVGVDSTEIAGNTTVGVLNRIAFTYTTSKLSLSTNGDTVGTKDVGGGEPWSTLRDVVLYGHYDFLRSITIYPPQDDADLPALSEI